MRDLVYYIAASLDGCIADPAGDVSAFPTAPETLADLFERYPETCPAHLRAALGVTASPRRFDTVLLGRRTHAPAVDAGLVDGAYPHLRQIVVTHGRLPTSDRVETMAGDVRAQVAALKREPGRDVWLCGGGDLAAQLIGEIDEIQVKISPLLLGAGVPLFGGLPQPVALEAVELRALPGGVALATYRRRDSGQL
ncbi:dihydrofolate reductase [Rathayibacter festucae]|uniref:Dihydrofolate reductase n=1 Tax=Rathayibacter festucae TaxID=110937 RepID=A0ABX6H021_9MICO|nr:dihydrofolate reductase family protein [Rathayibacter festucae]QHC63018.1 dihydrofolate reductase [Rathayibacter festucae]